MGGASKLIIAPFLEDEFLMDLREADCTALFVSTLLKGLIPDCLEC